MYSSNLYKYFLIIPDLCDYKQAKTQLMLKEDLNLCR